MYEELKEVLMPFNSKEVEHFNEATKDCTPEKKLAVAKHMAKEKLPAGYQFTEAQIRRFVAQDNLSKVNWYPGITINDGTTNNDTGSTLNEIKERQFNAYRAGGLSEAEAIAMSGFTPKAA